MCRGPREAKMLWTINVTHIYLQPPHPPRCFWHLPLGLKSLFDYVFSTTWAWAELSRAHLKLGLDYYTLIFCIFGFVVWAGERPKKSKKVCEYELHEPSSRAYSSNQIPKILEKSMPAYEQRAVFWPNLFDLNHPDLAEIFASITGTQD